MKTLHVTLHIWQRQDGTGCMDDTPDNRARLRWMMNVAHRHYNENYAPLPGVPYPIAFLPDSRIRVELDSIYFYHDPSADTSYYGHTYYGHNQLLDAYIDSVYPDRDRGLRIHLTGYSYNSGIGGYSDFGSIESFYRRNPEMNDDPAHDWAMGEHWAHEIGHGFDLWHTYDPGWTQNCHRAYPDFLWDVYDTSVVCGGGCDACLIPAGGGNNNLMGGGDDFYKSPLQLGIIHRSTMLENRYNVLCGIRDHCDGFGAQPYLVTTDQTWDFSVKFYQDLVITSGHTLTIECDVQFVPEARLIIEPGARVILDGGRLTNERYHRASWLGVEVRGNSNEDQFGSPLADHQGRLIIKNGGTIENAEIGAVACARDENGFFELEKAGGMIQVNSGIFKNCKWGVVFFPYQAVNNVTGALLNNLSYFRNCEFIVDQGYPGTYDFQSHVLMANTYGIRFQGCRRKNLLLDNEVSGSADLGNGIRSLDSKFTVGSLCTGGYLEPGHVCTSAIRSSFEGLDLAIWASDGTTTRNFTVTEADFDNNICGVFASGVINPVVRGNHFTMGKRAVDMSANTLEEDWFGLLRAVVTTESYATRIDDNSVEMDTNAQSEAEGIVVGFCRDHNDVVFRNRVSGVRNGYVGEGIDADPDNKTHAGLTWLCNENDGNDQDLYCRVPGGITLPAEVEPNTVRLIQGANNRPSDNTFDRVQGGGDTDFKSDNDQNVINYRFREDANAAEFEPEELTDSYVAKEPSTTIPPNNCANRVLIGHVIGDHPDGTFTNGIAVLSGEKLAYGNTRYLYDQLIDGGDPDEVVQEITSSWPQDAWDLRDFLQDRSPYLSTDALKRAVSQNVMPQAMLAEICVANPEATQRNGFLRWLQDESGYPLPEYLAGLIVASWDDRTYRSVLEGTMAEHHTNMTMAADLLVEAYQNDTVVEPLDSLRRVWQLVRTKGARYAEALMSMQTGDFAGATSLVEAMPEELDLKDPEELERQRMLALITFLETVYADDRTEASLTTGEIADLESINANSYDRPATWAQNILCYWYGHCRGPLTGGDPGEPRRFKPTYASEEPATIDRFWAQPNPAWQYTELCYELLAVPTNGFITVRDMAGRELQRFKITGNQGRVLWDTRVVEPGTYAVELGGGATPTTTVRVIVKR